jgi:hypothetical protein
MNAILERMRAMTRDSGWEGMEKDRGIARGCSWEGKVGGEGMGSGRGEYKGIG